MDEAATKTYEPPALEEVGKVHELTHGPVTGNGADLTFPHHLTSPPHPISV